MEDHTHEVVLIDESHAFCPGCGQRYTAPTRTAVREEYGFRFDDEEAARVGFDLWLQSERNAAVFDYVSRREPLTLRVTPEQYEHLTETLAQKEV